MLFLPFLKTVIFVFVFEVFQRRVGIRPLTRPRLLLRNKTSEARGTRSLTRPRL